MQLETYQQVALWGFLVAAVFGAVAYRTNFCTMGAVSDWVVMGDTGRLRAWFLAIGIAILGTQALVLNGKVNLSDTLYLNPNFSWLACVAGGLLFGVGMTLASGCGQRTLVRLGAGNLKSLLVVLLVGVTAYTTFRGLLAFAPRDIFWPVQVKLGEYGIADQSLASILVGMASLGDTTTIRMIVTGIMGLLLVAFAFKDAQFRRSFDNILAGLTVGLAVVAGWYITGVMGYDEFEPVQAESMSFILPTGDAVSYLMTWTGTRIDFAIAAVFGLIAGAFIYSVVTRRFRLEGFTSTADMMRHVIGAVLMGFGGIVGFGCTIGQGVTGVSTLSVGSLVTLASIIFGSALTIRIQYHQMDEMGFMRALVQALRDFRLLPATKD